jgi:hypothetical protein
MRSATLREDLAGCESSVDDECAVEAGALIFDLTKASYLSQTLEQPGLGTEIAAQLYRLHAVNTMRGCCVSISRE